MGPPLNAIVLLDCQLAYSHDGIRSCQLANADSSHKRFTTAAMSMPAGRYHCSYWVRGVDLKHPEFEATLLMMEAG